MQTVWRNLAQIHCMLIHITTTTVSPDSESETYIFNSNKLNLFVSIEGDMYLINNVSEINN